MKFAPDYVTAVLNDNFEDAKAQFLVAADGDPLRASGDARRAADRAGETPRAPSGRRSMRSIWTRCGRSRYDGTYEDLFFYVERLIVQAMRRGRGRPAAHRALAQRHRHDDVPDAAAGAGPGGGRWRRCGCATCCSTLADAHRDDVFRRAHAHPAGAAVDHRALPAGGGRAARTRRRAVCRRPTPAPISNPLGACAITGTGFPIDRDRTTALLGFDGATGNTYGSIATVDYLLESVSAAAVLLIGLGRVVQDLLLWCTSEFGYLRLSDGFVQCSSIMPQKRNPVALEHARAIASKAVGQASAHPARGPQHAVRRHRRHRGRSAAAGLHRCSAMPAGRSVWWRRRWAAPRSTRARMAERAAEGWITVTELADTLARDHGVPFKAGHAIASRLIAERHAPGQRQASPVCCAMSRKKCSAGRSRSTMPRWRRS